MSSEFKPCPFCGTSGAHEKNCYINLYFESEVLGADIPWDVMAKAWNQRAEPAYLAGYKDGYQMGKSAERTCNDVSKSGVFFECSECGAIDVTGGTGNYTLEYCPACGAKVVDDA